jgi:hypothetical protein
VADLSPGAATLHEILGDNVNVTSAGTMPEALQILEQGVDLIVCGVHFDESRMFDLLMSVKADLRARVIPFLCYRDLNSALDPTSLRGLHMSCAALGAAGFIDLYELKSQHGIPEADRRFRELICSLLNERSW